MKKLAIQSIEGDLNVDLALETVSGDGDFIKEGAGSLSFRVQYWFHLLVNRALNLAAGSDLLDLTAVSVDSDYGFEHLQLVMLLVPLQVRAIFSDAENAAVSAGSKTMLLQHWYGIDQWRWFLD